MASSSNSTTGPRSRAASSPRGTGSGGPPPPRRRRLNEALQAAAESNPYPTRRFGSLGAKMWNMQQNSMMTDMTLVVRPHEDGSDQVELEAHKLVLMAASNVITTLCEERWGQIGQRPVVELPVGIDLVSAQNFLQAVYLEQLENGLELETLLDVLILTDHYGIDFLIPEVDEKLMAMVNVDNCVRVYENVKLFDGLKAKSQALTLIVPNLKEKLESEECKTWSGCLWKMILSFDYLKGVEEIDLFKALLKWRDDDRLARSDIFASLFPLIRIPLLGAKAFTDHVVPSGLLSHEEILNFYAFFSDAANTHGIEANPRNIFVAVNTADLHNALLGCVAGDIIQLVEYVYDGHFNVKIPQTTIRGAAGGGSVIEFASTKGIPALYVMPSARETKVENIKFIYRRSDYDKKAVGTGINFRYSDSVHRAKNLVMEGPGPCIRVYGTAQNLISEDITGEIVYAPAH